MAVDLELLREVESHIKAKAEAVDAIRTARHGQLTTLGDLIDLLKGRYTMPAVESDDVAADNVQHHTQATDDSSTDDDEVIEEPEETGLGPELDEEETMAPSFLQSASSPKHGAITLQTEIETALQKKQDTHSILLRIKAQLARKEQPVDTGNVRQVVTKMTAALQAVENEHVTVDDAKRRCEEQKFGTEQDEKRIRGSLALMAGARNRTKVAIKAAVKNLNSTTSKAHALNKSSQEFSTLVGQAVHTLDSESKDRITIMAALKRAEQVAPHAVSAADAPGTVALLEQLVSQFAIQDKNERIYRARQMAMQKDLSDYAKGYGQLLGEQRQHYEAIRSALELYTSELSADATARGGVLNDDQILQREGKELCDSIMSFYKTHSVRRQELSSALRHVLPRLPEIIAPVGENIA